MSRLPKPVKYEKNPMGCGGGGDGGRSGEVAEGPRPIQLRPRRSVSKTRMSTTQARSLHKRKIPGKKSQRFFRRHWEENCSAPPGGARPLLRTGPKPATLGDAASSVTSANVTPTERPRLLGSASMTLSATEQR